MKDLLIYFLPYQNPTLMNKTHEYDVFNTMYIQTHIKK